MVHENKKTKKEKKDDKDRVIKTACQDWSLNEEEDPEEDQNKRFWWNRIYSVSIWENNMDLKVMGKGKVPKLEDVTDEMAWRGYIHYQINSVYKVCPICKQPEQNEDLLICCYCSGTVHRECSIKAAAENIAWKPANRGYEKHMCICFDCEDVKDHATRPFELVPDNARRMVNRTFASAPEYPASLTEALKDLQTQFEGIYGEGGSRSDSVDAETDAANRDKVQELIASYFQPGNSRLRAERRPIPSKGGGLGIVATVDIPRFTIIGVYPGYDDPLSGEQAKLGRPGPKYSLVDLNCADFHNRVFPEFDKCYTPYINEPNTDEESNTAWIQETIKPEGRLSVMTVRDIKAGEELLIGYGPLYPRTYPFAYDAYAYHPVENHDDPPCFALWHWRSLEEKDASFECYCGYDTESDTYSYWETEDEASADKDAKKKKKEKEGGK